MNHLTHVASRFVNTPLMIHPPKLDVIIKALGPRLGINPEAVQGQHIRDGTATLMSRYGSAGEERDYSVIDGIAVIPVQGTLLKRASFLSAWSGSSSYEQIQRQVGNAVADSAVSAILLDIDSPGGETAGCFDLADYIFSVRNQKPIWAVADDIALSAAYAIASSASRIYLNRTGAVGSIGVYALHMDQSGFNKNLGVSYTYVFAGERKVDANPHEPLSARARSDIQGEVDREYGIFTETVARNRNASPENIVATEAAVVWAENAIPLLADEIGTFEDALDALSAVRRSAKSSVVKAAARKQEPQKIPAKVSQASEGRSDMQVKTFREIEVEAARDAQALKFRGASLPGLYVPGAIAAPTKERAIAAYYESNPQAYAEYRNQHNARGMVATLEAAGIRLAR